jgi:hypothetical protein
MGIYNFGHGVRIPAGSCATYTNTPRANIATLASSLVVYNTDGALEVNGICQLAVPEKALVRQFVMVGNVSKGRIDAEIGAVAWNIPRRYTQFAPLTILPTTPFEVAETQQKKVVANLPTTGAGSLIIDRINCYFIQVRCTSDVAISLEDDMEVFYFEIYWD